MWSLDISNCIILFNGMFVAVNIDIGRPGCTYVSMGIFILLSRPFEVILLFNVYIMYAVEFIRRVV